jgi:hypothetical protein
VVRQFVDPVGTAAAGVMRTVLPLVPTLFAGQLTGDSDDLRKGGGSHDERMSTTLYHLKMQLPAVAEPNNAFYDRDVVLASDF